MTKSRLVNVVFEPEGTISRVPSGTLISKAASAAGRPVEVPCGGIGVCGKCRVVVSGSVSPPDATELHHITESDLADGVRLACRTKILGDCHISIPEYSRSVVQKILSHGELRECALNSGVAKLHCILDKPSLDDETAEFERLAMCISSKGIDLYPSLEVVRDLSSVMKNAGYDVTAVTCGGELIAVEPGDTCGKSYGVAFDLGSTSVVGFLMDLETGDELAVHSIMNPQMVYGDDLISRILFATTQENGRSILQSTAVDAMNRIMENLCKKSKVHHENIYKITVVGNTCMSHLLLGIDVHSLGQAPYVPSICRDIEVSAKSLGLNASPGAKVYVLPNIAGFVGSDTVGVMLASMWEDNGHTRLAVDIGTNGEMALTHKGQTYVCSAAAGPAFEGAGISCGMRGGSGAIDSVLITDQVHITVIGNRKPIGLCGSGLVDAVAQLLEVGIVDESGRMQGSDEVPGLPDAVKERLIQGANGLEFVLAGKTESGNGKIISLKESDIRHLQLAKGSIHAAIRSIISWAGAEVDDVTEIMLAGAFGNYIRVESAIRIGLIPDVGVDNVSSIGNAAGAGARLALQCNHEMETARKLASGAKHLELAVSPAYQMELMDQMMFPEKQ